MAAIPSDYLERLYSGFLGKNVGIRLGAPVEPAIWTYERIREVYGDVTGYLKPFRNFAADDDANGPVYFIRPLLDALEGGRPSVDVQDPVLRWAVPLAMGWASEDLQMVTAIRGMKK